MKKIALIIIFLALFSLALQVQAEIFGRDLWFGLKNDAEVSKLQQFLKDQNLYSGPISGNFFSLTQKALTNFQKREGISPATGYFGPKTRALANSLAKNSSPETSQESQFKITTSQTTPNSISINNADGKISDLQNQIKSLLGQVQLLQQQVQSKNQSSNQPPASQPPANQSPSNQPVNNSSPLVIPSGQSATFQIPTSLPPAQSPPAQNTPTTPPTFSSALTPNSITGVGNLIKL